jgi:hypothetical protein
VLGQIAAARGDRDAAREHLERSRVVLVAIDEPAELQRTEVALSRLG